ncbi:MAG TPA: hypothetical protein VG389_08395 [Myxococcota bacterium]|nr:hypothetical protein [Myxococcota bacterium]
MRCVAASFPAIAALLAAWPTLADPHPMAGGAHPAPSTDVAVGIAREVLSVTVGPKTAAVDALLVLENHGAPTKLMVGFPCDAGPEPGAAGVPCKTKITVTADGKPIAAKVRKTSAKEWHWVWPMAFGAAARVALAVRYDAPLINPRYEVPVEGMGLFHYRLTTGARWAGPIGELEITVNTPFDALIWISPGGYVREPGRLTWRLKDVEPAEDLVFAPAVPVAAWEYAALGGGSIAEVRARRDAGDFEKKAMLALVERLKEDFGEHAEAERIVVGYLGVIARMSGLPLPAPERLRATALESARVLESLALRAAR